MKIIYQNPSYDLYLDKLTKYFSNNKQENNISPKKEFTNNYIQTDIKPLKQRYVQTDDFNKYDELNIIDNRSQQIDNNEVENDKPIEKKEINDEINDEIEKINKPNIYLIYTSIGLILHTLASIIF